MKNAVFWDATTCDLYERFGRSASIIRMERIVELGTTLAATSNRRTLRRHVIPVTLMMEALRSSETPVLTRATQRIIPEDGIRTQI
jgi:hypothetical protein